MADAKKAGKSFFRGTAPRRFHGRFRGGRGQYRAPYRGFFRPTLLKLSDHKHILQGQEQSPIYPVPRAISAKTTTIVLACPGHLPSGMFRSFVNFPNDLPQAGRLKHFFSSMGTDYKGPLGPPSSLRLSNRDFCQSCTTKHPSSYPMFIGTSNLNRSGGLGTVIKKGSPFRSTRFSTGTRIHQFPFCNTQKGWGHRPVINLKPLNCFIPYEHFKMESIHMLKDLLKKGDYVVKIDLKDAYLTVPI